MAEPQKEEPNEEQQHQLTSSAPDPEYPAPADRSQDEEERTVRAFEAPPQLPAESPAPADHSQDEEERTVRAFEAPPQLPAEAPANFLPHFKRRKFFVLRPGTLNQAIKEIEALVDKEMDGNIHSFWLMAEVDHWNNEKERLVLITDNTLLVFKYDFVMFNCDQIQRIPLNFVDRITYGAFNFPKHSLLRREGEGLRIFWDRLREPSFTSRWNPFTTDFPYITFTYHPVRDIADTFTSICDIHAFREQLKDAALKVHALKPVPGKANGILVLNQNIQIEAYVGLMSFIGNQNKLGYCMARGNVGF